VARCLIIGCGCRGQMLARALVGQGHAVRGTTRRPERAREIEAAGAESAVGDPDRLGSLVGALDHVSVALILLGSAGGNERALAELHGPRLQALLTKMIDSTIHGVVYEASGTVATDLLEAGRSATLAFGERARARVALLEADPADREGWLEEALSSVEAVLAPG
jgi:threonine dehydrogenase-like Zn-dependent dehydrogenase